MNIIDLLRPRKGTHIEQMTRRRQSVRLTAELMRNTDSLTKKDLKAWRMAWQQAIDIDNPRRDMLYDIYTDSLIDLHLCGCIDQRKGKTLARSFSLLNDKGEPDEKATSLLRSEWFYDFVDMTLDSRFWGHSLIELGDVTPGGYTHCTLVPRKHVVPEYGVVLRERGDSISDGIPYRTGDFALWTIEVGKTHDLGLLLKCAPSCISKKNMLAFWDMFGEIFGAPMRVARSSAHDKEERRRIENALDNMGAAFWALFPEGTDIEIKESTKGDAFNVYDRRVDRCNSELSKGILMQTMTIDNGSSHSQSEVHLEIFEDVVNADARFVATIINDRLLPLMVKHGHAVGGLHFAWDNSDHITPEQQIEMERELLQHYDIDPQYFVDKYHVPVSAKQEGPTGAQLGRMSDSFFA